MKTSLVCLSLAAALALPTLGSATTLSTMTWNFLNDVPAHSAGVSVASSHSFTDTKGDPTTITASVYTNHGGFRLFEKNEGGNEKGLGVSSEGDHEINAGQPGILLDLSDLLELDPSTISISFGSLTGSEIAKITYLDDDRDGDTESFKVYNQAPVNLDLSELREEGGSILITADRGDVLIGSITATPEPAVAGLMGIGLVACGFIGRKRLSKQA